MASFSELVSALSAGGPGQAANAASEGFMKGRQLKREAAADDLESRKAALAKRIQEAGLFKAGELGDLPTAAGINLSPERDVSQAVLTNLTALAEKRAEAANKKAAVKTAAEPASDALIDAFSKTSGLDLSSLKGKGLTAQQVKDTMQGGLRREGIEVSRTAPARSMEARLEGPVPQATVDKAGALREVQGAIQDTVNLYKPELVGPIEGRLGRMKQAMTGGTPETSRFYGASAALQNAILKARSGGAVTPAEADRLLNEIPNVNAADYIDKMQRVQQMFNAIVEAQNVAAGGYKAYTPVPTTTVGQESPADRKARLLKELSEAN